MNETRCQLGARGVRRIVFALALLTLSLPALAAAQAPFTVAGITAQPGTLASGEMAVSARGADAGTTIPFSILNGVRPGLAAAGSFCCCTLSPGSPMAAS